LVPDSLAMSNHDPISSGDVIAEAPLSKSSSNADAEQLREIPPVSAIVASAKRRGSELTIDVLTRVVRAELEDVRQALLAGEVLDRPEIEYRVIEAVGALERSRLTPVLNATGVVVHTNLGRAPVSPETAAAMREAAEHPVPLEIDLETNERGGRMREIAGQLRALTGAESALVVNNCASAVLLALAAVASGKDVVVSRGEAVEIGGGFRVPDVLRQSGAHLVEVGTTNRTYARDYAAATTEETGAYLKVHPSNFRAFGFVHSASTAELVALAHEHGLPVLEDLGSGALVDTSRFGLAPEPTLTGAIAAGADLVMASADKLLGGPQGGIIIGGASWVERVARHPLARAVRADKTALAGIAATLRHYLRGEAESHVPIWRMISAPESEIQARVSRLATALGQENIVAGVEPAQATIGGGSLPGETLPSWALVLSPTDGEGVDALARSLRLGDPGIFGRIDRDRLLLDLRTVLPEDDEILLRSLRNSLGA
jgi:L-seryl-tRNA(Ser) seleniumtransferase